MPALPDVPLTIRIRLTSIDGGGAQMQNFMYYTYTGTAAATDLNTLMGIVVSAWSTNISPHYSTNGHLTGVEITDLNSKTGAKVAETVSVAGTQAGNELTSGVAAVISGKESDRYRGGHRRIYLPSRNGNDLADANTWSVALQSAISAAWQAFVNQIISAAPAAIGAMKDVIVHRFGATAGAPVLATSGRARMKSVPLTIPITHAITSYATNPQVASQRRRNQQTS
jgi:hypothetical protein